MCRFENSQEWCDHRNSTMERPDLKWVLGPSGELLLVDREEWSDAHAKAEDDHKESERRKFNWRQDHPIRSEL